MKKRGSILFLLGLVAPFPFVHAGKFNLAVISVGHLSTNPTRDDDVSFLFDLEEELDPTKMKCQVDVYKTVYNYLNNYAQSMYAGNLAANQVTLEADLQKFVRTANEETIKIADGKMDWSPYQTLERELSMANQLIAPANLNSKEFEVKQFSWHPELLGFVNFDPKVLKTKDEENRRNGSAGRIDIDFQEKIESFIANARIQSDNRNTVKLVVDLNYPLYLEDIRETIWNSSPKLRRNDRNHKDRVEKLAKTTLKLNQKIFERLVEQYATDVIFVISAQKSLPQGRDLGEENFQNKWLPGLQKGGEPPKNVLIVAEMKVVPQKVEKEDGEEEINNGGQISPTSNFSSDFIKIAAPSTYTLRGKKNSVTWTWQHSGVSKSVVAVRLAQIAATMVKPTRDELLNKFFEDSTIQKVPGFADRIEKGRVFMPTFGLLGGAGSKAVDFFIPRKIR